MTMIDVDTSPLQAAREWRGIGLVAAAMNSGLPVAQAEALEGGDPAAFSTIDEMIAAAVVYGASIGIGRDEAVALLDRTVCRTGAQVDLPDPTSAITVRPNEAFSGAVHERAARISDREDVVSDLIAATPLLTVALTDQEQVAHPVLDPIIEEPAAPSIELPTVPVGPTPEQAVAASGELHLDSAFGPDGPWEREYAGSFSTGELETWVDDVDDFDSPTGTGAFERAGAKVDTRVGGATFAALERIVGTDRADAIADRTQDMTARLSELARAGREKLRRSEHATLFVAIGAGAVLIAIVVALGGALGGDEQAGPGPAKRAPEAAPVPAGAANATKAGDKVAARAAVKPMIPPARLTLDIFNAGSKKGYAKEIAAKLDGAGYKIGEVTNAKSSYASATIIHPADMVREARLLARRTGITTLQVAPGSTRKITIIVT